MLRKEIYELPQLALFLSKFRFRVSNFFKGASQCFLRSLSLDGDYGDMTRAFDQSQISLARGAGLRIVHSERAEHVLVLGEERLRPRGAQPVTQSKVPIISPQRVSCNAGNDHPPLQKCGRAARTYTRANL